MLNASAKMEKRQGTDQASLCEEVHQFGESSSVHGLKYVTGHSSSCCRRSVSKLHYLKIYYSAQISLYRA